MYILDVSPVIHRDADQKIDIVLSCNPNKKEIDLLANDIRISGGANIHCKDKGLLNYLMSRFIFKDPLKSFNLSIREAS